VNLLQIVQAATGEMGLPVPTFVAGNGTKDAIQQLALLNAVGSELVREFEWQGLAKEYRVTTQYLTTTGTTTANSAVLTGVGSTTGLDSTYMVAGTGINQDTYILSVDSPSQVTLSQACTASGTVALSFGKTKYALPSDYDCMIDRTQYDKSKRWAMIGPETAQQWQFLKSSYISTGPRLRWRIMGGYFQIWPMIATPEYLGFEYYSSGWVNTYATPKSSFTADADTCIYPDRLMVLGLKLKYFQAKGLDFGPHLQAYNRILDQAKANDHGAPMLSMYARQADVLIGIDQVPDTGYGG
jgi:hypothetical protein